MRIKKLIDEIKKSKWSDKSLKSLIKCCHEIKKNKIMRKNWNNEIKFEDFDSVVSRLAPVNIL